jgi:hypothetical protein
MNKDRTPKSGFEHETGNKMPNRKTKIKMKTKITKDILQKEGRAWEGTEEEEGLMTYMKVEMVNKEAEKKTVVTCTYKFSTFSAVIICE